MVFSKVGLLIKQKNTKGQYLLDHVCNTLDLVETDYFGLRYLNQERQQVSLIFFVSLYAR